MSLIAAERVEVLQRCAWDQGKVWMAFAELCGLVGKISQPNSANRSPWWWSIR